MTNAGRHVTPISLTDKASRQSTGSLSLAIVVVSYNVRDLLRACLAATYASLAHEDDLDAMLWVVDNASTDGSAEMTASAFPQARLIASLMNLGFAGGNNLALRTMGLGGASPSAGPDRPQGAIAVGGRIHPSDVDSVPQLVMLLNPDAEPRADAIGRMARFLRDHPAAGGVGAQLRYPDGRFQHGAFRFPGLWQLWFDFFPPRPRRLLDSRLNGRYPLASYEAGEPFPIDFALGAALMVRREAIWDAGLLDEGYFMYAEEVDWCWRIRRAGWPLYCAPAATVMHHGGASTRQFRARSFINLWRSRYRLYERFYSPAKRRLASLIVSIGMPVEAHRAGVAAKRGEIPADELSQRLEAIRQVTALFRGGLRAEVR